MRRIKREQVDFITQQSNDTGISQMTETQQRLTDPLLQLIHEDSRQTESFQDKLQLLGLEKSQSIAIHQSDNSFKNLAALNDNMRAPGAGKVIMSSDTESIEHRSRKGSLLDEHLLKQHSPPQNLITKGMRKEKQRANQLRKAQSDQYEAF